MKRNDYFAKAAELYGAGEISGEVYDAMIMNADKFCDDDVDEYGLTSTYAEIEYDDMESPEAILGSRWDDVNYRYYMER